MEGSIDNNHQHIDGVKCVVNNCKYHCPGDYCSASKIEIQPCDASNTRETDCGTFVSMK